MYAAFSPASGQPLERSTHIPALSLRELMEKGFACNIIYRNEGFQSLSRCSCSNVWRSICHVTWKFWQKKKKTEHKAFRIAFDLSSNQIHVTVCCVFQVQVEKTNIRERQRTLLSTMSPVSVPKNTPIRPCFTDVLQRNDCEQRTSSNNLNLVNCCNLSCSFRSIFPTIVKQKVKQKTRK